MDAKISTKTKTKTVPVQNLFRYISFSKKICENRDCFNKGIIILAGLGFFKHSICYRSGDNGKKYFLKEHSHFHAPANFLHTSIIDLEGIAAHVMNMGVKE